MACSRTKCPLRGHFAAGKRGQYPWKKGSVPFIDSEKGTDPFLLLAFCNAQPEVAAIAAPKMVRIMNFLI
jgi:hypothetical protein